MGQQATLALPAVPDAEPLRQPMPGQRQRVRPIRGQLRMVFDRTVEHRNKRTREVAPLVIREGDKVALHVVGGDRVDMGAGRISWCEDYDSALRPRYRWQCADVPRPCPYVSCERHLYLDVEPDGSLRLNFPDVELDELRWSCASDLAEQGKAMPSELARRVNKGREGFRKEYRATLGRFAEAWEALTGERAPMLDGGDVTSDGEIRVDEMGEIGDIEW